MKCANAACSKPAQERRAYCSPECKREAMAARRRVVAVQCACGAVESYELPVWGRPPERCRRCHKAAQNASKRAAYRRAVGREVLEGEEDEAAMELRASRQRLLCEFTGFRLQVQALARDLGLTR